jgi:hypothetical protein
MKTKYTIGDIVILLTDDIITNRYIVLATEKQSLNDDYLKPLTRTLNIKDVSKLAGTGIKVTKGFKYKICKLADKYENEICVLEGNFIDILDDTELIN